MAKLYFKVSSDYDEVIRLRQECEKLEAQLKKMDVNKAPAAARALETQLASARQQMKGLVTEAAKAGAVMEHDFKNGIYNASQTVNDLTQKIIDQKRVVKDVQFDVKRLGEAYKEALKTNPISASARLAEYKAAKRALEEEKAALFGLTQQQAEARLTVKKLKDEYSAFNQESEKTVQSSEGFSLSLKKVLGVIGGVTALKQLASEIIRVRGEFQSMDTAIETMVGKDMANRLIPQIKELAKISPLTVSDMVGAEKMMLGFNIQAEDTIRYLQALSDISMGDSVKFKSLTLAFSQMSAAGKLMGQDLNQMINAGFNPLQIISEKTGKSIATLKDEMSKGAVSAEIVQQAFIDATSAGGKFYNMSSNASKTINGQISMMEDALDAAFNDIGKASEGIIMGGIQATTSLIQNYETVGKVLVGLIATYGVYKAALIANIVLTKSWAVAARADATAKALQTIATKGLTIAQSALNSVMKANPYVLVATVLTGLIATMWAFHDSITETEAVNESLSNTLEEVNQKEQEHKEAINELIEKATDDKAATEERNAALKSLVMAYPSIIKKYIDEEGHLTNIIALKKEIAELDSQRTVMTLGKKASKNQEYVNFLRNVKSRKIDLNSDEKSLNWYKSLEQRALKSYHGRYALSIDEMISFYEKMGKGLNNAYNRSKTETKINKFTSGFKDNTDEKLDNILKSRKKILSKFTGKIGYVYDAAIKDYVKKTDIEAQIAQIEGIQNTRKVGKNKAYWEKKEKEAKANLEALDVSQKGSKQWNKYVKEIEESQQKIDMYSTAKHGSGGSKGSKGSKRVSQAIVQDTKLAEIEKKQADERAKEAADLENQVEQARIDAMADGGEKVAAQQALNNKKEMQAIDRAKEEYIRKEIQRQKEIFEAKENMKAKNNPGYKKKAFDSSSVSVDTSSFDKLKDFTEQKQLQDRLKAEKEAMNSYLTEYGTYQQRKLAIAEEYAKKIQEAQTEGERLSLGKQRDKAIADVNLSAIKQNIDWAGVFGDFGSTLREEIEHSLDSLRAYMKSDEFRNMDPEDQSKIVEAVNNMRGNVAGNLSDVSFKQIGDLTNELQDAQRRMITTYYAEIDAYGNLKKAQEDYQNAIKNGTPEQKAAAKTNLDTAKTIAENMSDSYKKAVDEFSATGNNLRDATNKAVDAINSVSSAISQIKSGSLSGAFGGIQQLSETLGKSLSGLSGVLGKAGSELSKFASSLGGATGEIVSAVLGVVDLLKDGLGSIFADLSDLMFNAVNGILDDLRSGGIITKPLQSVVDGVSNILNTITFGGFNSLLGGNDKDVMETVSRLTDSNKYLQESIDRLSERIGDESNTAGQTLDYYITAKDAEEQWRENQQEIIKNLASAWTNTGYGFLGLGGKGTFNGHAPDSNWSGWDSFSKTLKNFGFDITLHNTGDFWELTPEQMALLRDNNPKEWQKLFDSDGHKNPIEAVEEYIEHAGKLEELTDVLNENLTKISFDSLYDNFIDTLMDMDASAEDFADNMSEYFMRAALSDKVGEMFKTRLNNWYNDFASAMEDGALSDNEIEALRNSYNDIVKDAMAERDDLANAIGYTSSDSEQQSASSKGFETMSQDTADELNGRFTALYESNLRIETAEQQQTVAITELKGNISALTAQAVGIYNIADETRTILANSYLELQQIRENTGEIVKPIKQMQADIAEVKRNTSRL
jgi:tape measure domain-containing protein